MSSIVTNIAALNAQRNLSMTGLKLGKVLEKLSSGYRINRAADDAAGLGISEKITAQINGNNQAIRNAQDGISMLQTAEGAMDEIHSMLQRIRELAIQAANGTYDVNARTSIGQEMLQLHSEIDRIAQSTQFNGQNLLSGTLSGTLGPASTLNAGVAVGAANVSSVDVSTAKAETYNITSAAAGQITVTGATSGQAQVINLTAIAANGASTIDVGQLGIKISLVSAAGETAANLATGLAGKSIVVTGTGAAVLQIGANATANDTLGVSFGDVSTAATGLDLVSNVGANLDWSSAMNVVADNTHAQAIITQVDAAITKLSTTRGTLGASQNRLEHTIASLGVSVENLTASESRIKDADIAALSSQMASDQILQQAGTAVLAQANQSSQSVLKLLQ